MAAKVLVFSVLAPVVCVSTNQTSGTCKVGDAVMCPGSIVRCAGEECCPDNTVCPSAPDTWDMCQKPKTSDCTSGGGGNWYDGIDSVKIFAPGDDVTNFSKNLYFGNMESAQFSDKRYAILLKRGSYGADNSQIPVGYYTSLLGLGERPSDTSIASFYSLDNPDIGNACDNFWRHVEGVQTTNPSIMWAASQAAPVRRVHIQSELWLSEKGSPHWSSGGLLADSTVDGTLQMGTQQQFLVRNNDLNGGVSGESHNYVFLGSKGAPASNSAGSITNVPITPRVSARPFITEDDGAWSIVVPLNAVDVVGNNPIRLETIDFSDVFVAKEGDSAATINAGIASKKALLLTPGIYGCEVAITIQQSDFVVLGIGFATLVALNGQSAINVVAGALNVHIASVLLEAGTPVNSGATKPLLMWSGDNGVGADIFTRVGAFSYSRSFKPSCLKTEVDTHIQIDGSGVTLENIWAWHADHDDCGGASDSCVSQHGLVVRGSNVVVYGLKAEHTFNTIVQWYGESGQVYLFQSELPYHSGGYTGAGAYNVDPSVKSHKGVGLGVYQIATYTVDTGLRVPPSADITNAFVWVITGQNTRFRSVICTSASGLTGCAYGDRCDYATCYQYHTGSGLSGMQLSPKMITV